MAHGLGRWRLAGKIAVATLSAVVTALLAARGGGLWQPPRGLLLGLITSAAILAVVSSTTAAVADYRGQRAAARRDDIAFLLSGAAWDLHDLTGIDPRELGLAVYLVRREGLRPWRRRLVRLHRERARRRVTASNVVWRPGKGVIGTCVLVGQDVGQDLDADYGALGEVTQEQWDTKTPEKVKLGLTYEEFLDVNGKYGAVVATPIIEDRGTQSRTVGCLALDGPPESFARLKEPDARMVLSSAALSLVRLVL